MNEKNNKTDQEKEVTGEALRAHLDAFKTRAQAEQVLKDVEDKRLNSILEHNKALKKQNKKIKKDIDRTQKEFSKFIKTHNDYLNAKNLESVARATLVFTLQTRVHDLQVDLTMTKSHLQACEIENEYLRSELSKLQVEASK